MTHDFQSVRALLRNSDPRSREIVTGVLGILGCRQLIIAQSNSEAEHFLRSDMVDLLVVDAEQCLPSACNLIQQMRHRPAADNTFALSMVLASPPNASHAAHLMESGADSIVIKPLDPVRVAERITALVKTRRPFVVTSAYVGPERRGPGMRPGCESAPRVIVPNPLREMALATMSRDELRRGIRAGWDVVNEHRIERQAAHLSRLVNRLKDAFCEDKRIPAATARTRLLELRDAAAELRLRVEGSGYDHVAHLASTMVDICCGLGRALDNPDSRLLAMIPKLAASIAQAFLRERDAIRSARSQETVMSRPRAEMPAIVRSYH
jgi:DNA-binding response OmpR family regulator